MERCFPKMKRLSISNRAAALLPTVSSRCGVGAGDWRWPVTGAADGAVADALVLQLARQQVLQPLRDRRLEDRDGLPVSH